MTSLLDRMRRLIGFDDHRSVGLERIGSPVRSDDALVFVA